VRKSRSRLAGRTEATCVSIGAKLVRKPTRRCVPALKRAKDSQRGRPRSEQSRAEVAQVGSLDGGYKCPARGAERSGHRRLSARFGDDAHAVALQSRGRRAQRFPVNPRRIFSIPASVLPSSQLQGRSASTATLYLMLPGSIRAHPCRSPAQSDIRRGSSRGGGPPVRLRPAADAGH
jgi:hypothetical protein